MVQTGKYYDVVKYKGHSGLCVMHSHDFDDVVKDIGDIVKRAKEQGYNNDERWIIVAVEWGREWTDDEVFISSWEKRKSFALYDNGKVTFFEE